MRKLLAFVCLFLILAASAHAELLIVPLHYPTIQAAVDAAQPGDVVQVSPGTYGDVTHQPGGGDTTHCAVVMKSGITLRGAGMGVTIIDCDILGRGIHCDGVTNAVIEELTVREAFAAVRGAGILCKNGSNPTINRCELVDNLDGGIICYDNSSPTISGCTMFRNVNKEGGGLLMDTDCSPVVSECLIDSCSAPGGGGVQIRAGGTPVFNNCIITNNWVNQDTGAGGGFASISASPTLNNCLIKNNTSANGGGGVYSTESALQMTNCLVQGNQTENTDAPGAGVLLDFNTVATLQGCTITDNTMQQNNGVLDGGGVACFFATDVTLSQCTIAKNHGVPGSLGSGVSAWMYDPQNQFLTIEKCIIAYNEPGAGLHCVDEISIPSTGCSDLFGNVGGDALCGTDAGHNFSLSPQFCDLAGNDYRLQTGSPCAAGQHPEGAGVCDGSRIGSQGLGCGPTGADEGAPPARAAFLSSRPNPFGRSTTIGFELPASGPVSLQIFDVSGRLVRTLRDGVLPAGRHQAVFDGRDAEGSALSDGIYFCRLRGEGFVTSRPIVLAR